MRTTCNGGPILVTGLLSVALTATASAGSSLRVSEFGNLQSAIDVAGDGDTVVVDFDTEGAVLDKRLILRGMPGRAGGWITGTPLAMVSTGLLLDTGASGSELINLKIRAEVAVASATNLYGLYSDGPADDVVVRGCRFEVDAFGLYLTAGDPAKGNWVIERNTIKLEGATRYFGGSFGVAMIGNWSDMRVAHNKIAGTKPPGDPQGAGGIAVFGGDDVELVHNEIAVNVEPAAGSWADAVWLISGTNVTVAMNDFRGCSTTRGPYGVTFEGVLDAQSDMTGLHAFDHIPASNGDPGRFTIGGNLSSGSSNRGELSKSEVPLERLFVP